jgi:hypothetical protein
MAHAGSCLCGRVRFRVDEPLRPFGNCHCSMCRKATEPRSGPLTRTCVLVPLASERTSSPGTSPHRLRTGILLLLRVHDRHADRAFPDSIAFSIAALDTIRARPVATPAAFKAPWFHIADAIPSYDEAPPPGAEPIGLPHSSSAVSAPPGEGAGPPPGPERFLMTTARSLWPTAGSPRAMSDSGNSVNSPERNPAKDDLQLPRIGMASLLVAWSCHSSSN